MDKPVPRWHAEARRLADHLGRRGIQDAAVLDVIARTPRHRFVPQARRMDSYADTALGIECGQTISQPYIVAAMTEAAELTGRETVLEIGTGSGYQAAILAQLADRVVTMERHQDLSASAQSLLAELGYDNIDFVSGDGTLGWPDEAPYDAILVTAAAPNVPEALWSQLAEGGRLVIPVGPEASQQLLQIKRQNGQPVQRVICDCRFVKLIGVQGWPDGAGDAEDDS